MYRGRGEGEGEGGEQVLCNARQSAMWLITFESQVISVITKAMYAGVAKQLATRWHSHDDQLNTLQRSS